MIKNKLDILSKYLMYGLLFIFPLFFSTLFEGIFETSKLMILAFFVLLISIIKLISTSIKGNLEFNSSPLDLPLLSLLLGFILSLVFATQNKIESLLVPGSIAFMVLGVILYFLINQLEKSSKNILLTILLSVAFIGSIVQIVAFFGINQMFTSLADIFKVSFFNVFGNILNHIVFLVALLPILIYKIIKSEDLAEKILISIVTLAVVVSISTSVFTILPNKEASVKLLDARIGWSIAADSIKNSPLFGAGVGNFSQAYNIYRPIVVNQTDDWAIKFSTSSSTLLTIVTEIGLIGLLALIFLVIRIIKNVNISNPLSISGLILLVGLATLPLTYSFFVITFIVLAISQKTNTAKHISFDAKNSGLLVTIPLAVLTLIIFYFTYRGLFAEYLYSQSIKLANQGKGVESFELVNKSILANSYIDRYRLFSSGLSLAIAENIAQKEGSELTETDKQNISSLIQKAIEDGKAAVSLNPSKSSNWEALSDIYRTVSTFAQGADEFAVQSLSQAVALDPINPILRVKLGGLYYSLEKYELSIEVLKLAVLAKRDFPNAHYNLSLAYKANNQLDKAKESMNNTLALIGKDSADYEVALKELQDIEGLTEPQEAPEPIIEPQLDLPQQSEEQTETLQ